MDVVMSLAVGGLIGWGASVLLGSNDRQAIALHAIVGTVGAFLGGLLLGESGSFSVTGVLVALLGAITLLALMRFARAAL